MMHCFMCKGNLYELLTTYMIDLGSTIVIIKNVPSLVCEQCGEVSYSDEVAQELEKIINKVKNTTTEIAVLNYNHAA